MPDVSNKPWSDFPASAFDDAQYKRACLISGEGKGKSDSKLPVREPSGTLNKNALQAAYSSLAGARGGVQLSSEDRSAAVSKLKRLYSEAGLEWRGDPGSSDHSVNSMSYQTPYDFEAARKVGRRLWRKQVAPFRSIKLGDTNAFDFTREKALAVKQGYESGAFDQVPFVIGHTNDPEKGRGEVRGFEVTPDGLDALLETDERGSEMIQSNPKLGVSMRYLENYVREADGKSFGPTIQHVAATYTPRMTGMRPWEAVEAGEEDEEYVDLTGEEYEEDSAMSGADEGSLELTEEEGEMEDELTSSQDSALTQEEEALVQEVMREMSEMNLTTERTDMANQDPPQKGDAVSVTQGGKTVKGTVQSIDANNIATLKLEDGSTTKAPASTLKVAPDADDSSATNTNANANGGRQMSEEDGRAVELSEAQMEAIRGKLFAEFNASPEVSRMRDMAESSARQLKEEKTARYLDECKLAGVPPWAVDLARPMLLEDGAAQELEVVELSGEGSDSSMVTRRIARGDQVKKFLDNLRGTIEFGERGHNREEAEGVELSQTDFDMQVSEYAETHKVGRQEAIRAVGNRIANKS